MNIIDEMPAGRTMDVVIATDVMGLDVVGESDAFYVDGSWFLEPSGDRNIEPVYVYNCQCEYLASEHWKLYGNDTELEIQQRVEDHKKFKGHDRSCLCVVPFYSTDDSISWEMIEKISGKPLSDGQLPNFQLHFCSILKWTASFRWDYDDNKGIWGAREKTAPLAICKAAWKAKKL